MTIATRLLWVLLLLWLPAACSGDAARDQRAPTQNTNNLAHEPNKEDVSPREAVPREGMTPRMDAIPRDEGHDAGQDVEGLARFLDQAPHDPFGILDQNEEERIWAAVRRIYAARGDQPVWLGEPARARALLAAIEDAERHGLAPEDYGLTRLRTFFIALHDDAALSRAQRVAFEIALTEAFLSLADDLATGRLAPEAVDASWHMRPEPPDLAAVLEQALRRDDIAGVLDGQAPSQRKYAQLRGALQRYRAIAAAGGWPRIPGGVMLEAGKEANPARVRMLRQRLAAEGYLDAGDLTGEALYYDAELAEAVGRFQASQGLQVDSVVGPRTLHALNVPAQDRVHQIALNLERWRWLPPELGNPHIRVNIAAFQLGVYEEDQIVMDMPVIVGKKGWSTPFFHDAIDHVVLNPYWDVPRSIAVEDILPKVRADPGYLLDNDFVVLDGWGENATELDPYSIDWSAVSAKDFPYRFRQLPGPNNALGHIKFMFPNQFSIYLHDTPNDDLFDRRKRALSHGCIRVARPLDLAAYLFRTDPAWNRARFAQAIRSGRHMRVDLPAPVPVYLLYWTAFVDDQGQMQFRPDIYGVDAAQSRALSKLEQS